MDVSSTRFEYASFIDELPVGHVCRYPKNPSGAAFRHSPSISCYAHMKRAFPGKGDSVFD